MAKTEIRSEFMNESLADFKAIEKQIESNIAGLVNESVRKSFNSILKEAEEDEDLDDANETEEKDTTEVTPVEGSESAVEEEGDAPEESEVDTLETDVTDEETASEDADAEGESEDVITATPGEDELEGAEALEGEDDDDVWSAAEEYKIDGTEDEYDGNSMPSDLALKVFKKMSDDDQVVLQKDEEGNIKLQDDATGAEYVIELGDEEGVDAEEPMIDENIEPVSKKQPFTVPGGNGSRHYDNAMKQPKPYGNAKDNAEETVIEIVTEDCDGELCEEDEANINEIKNLAMPVHHAIQKMPKEDRGKNPMVQNENPIAEGYLKKYQAIVNEAKKIQKENAEVKDVLMKFRTKLHETTVLNAKLSKMVKLFVENATSADEKKSIVEQFSNVKELQECETLYESISQKLKEKPAINEAVIADNKSKAIEPKENVLYENNAVKRFYEICKLNG